VIDRISGRIALFLAVVTVMCVALIGWFVLISPERAKATKLEGQIGDTQTQLAAVTALLNGPAGKQAFAQLKVLSRAVPDSTRMSEILRQLSAASTQTGVELDTITPGAATGNSVPITLNVKGRYFALQQFLRIVRSEARAVDGQARATGRLYSVDGIQFTGGALGSSSTPTGSPSVISASLTVEAYVFAPTVTTTPATTDTTTTSP
jgi:Tfp pilus assembly protein PilO